MSKLSPPSQGSSSNQVQVQGTDLILQDQTEQTNGLISTHTPGFVLLFHSPNDVQIM